MAPSYQTITTISLWCSLTAVVAVTVLLPLMAMQVQDISDDVSIEMTEIRVR